jgi:colanic acid/amylovoran biosynthesis glycosyltransferase
MTGRIAYIVSRFPTVAETFVLREMIEVERQGWPVSLFPLVRDHPAALHPEVAPWVERAHFLPFVSAAVLGSNAHTLLRQPSRYVAAGLRAVWENLPAPKFLARVIALFPKTIAAAAVMQRAGVTHIHAHFATHPALAAWLVHRVTGISYSFTIHAHDLFVCTAMLPTKVREAAFVAVISDYNRQRLQDVVGSDIAYKTHVVRCGIDPSYYRPATEVSRRTPGERFELLTVGSLRPYKGQHYLVEACRLLRDRGIPVRCRIVGEGEERSRLEEQIRATQLADFVQLLGALPQDEVARLLTTGHCYVQPSIITATGKMEGIPVSLMEALVCGLPVVATSLSGIPELVRPAETGYLVPPADPVALADALAGVYADPEQATRLAKAGHALVQKEYDLHSNVARLVSLFQDVHRAPSRENPPTP